MNAPYIVQLSRQFDVARFVELQRLTIAAGDNLSQVMALIASHALKLLPNATGAVIGLREGHELVSRACSGSVSPHVGFRFDLRTNRTWTYLASGAPFMCIDTETDERIDRNACRAMGVRSMMLVPIRVDGETKGVLNITSDQALAFCDEDLLAAELLAGPVTIGLAAEVRRQQTTAHAELDRRFRATFEQAAVGIAHVGLNGRFLRVNDRFCTICGHDRDILLDGDFQTITHPDDLDADLAQVEALKVGEIDSYTMEKRYIRPDGRIQWVRLTVSLVAPELDHQGFFVAIIEDIDTQKAAQQETLEDALTGLPNRKWLASNLPRALSEIRRGRHGMGVTFIDLDGFKSVNDHFGHETGDECLRETARRLKRQIGPFATAVRLSGDEFVLISRHVDEQQLRLAGGRAQASVAELGKERCWPINASVGSVFVPAGLEADASEIMKLADGMMYTAKRAGGNRHIMTVAH